MIRLNGTNLLTTSPNFDTFVKFLTCGSSPCPLAKSWLRAKPDPKLLIFYSLPHKKSLFSKISDYVIACDLRFAPPQSKILYALNHVQCACQIPVVHLYCYAHLLEWFVAVTRQLQSMTSRIEATESQQPKRKASRIGWTLNDQRIIHHARLRNRAG